MTKYIYALYATLVVTMLVVVVASAHNIFADEQSGGGPLSSKGKSGQLSEQVSVSRSTVPTLTVVPVLGPDYNTADTLIREKRCTDPTTRAERRACRAEAFAFSIDSLVSTRSFAFYPTTMQASPRGELRSIYAQYYYIFVSPVDLEVHLPIEFGITQYVSMLNFDTDTVNDFHTTKHLSQWVITFSAATLSDTYYFNMLISTITGETELLVQSSRVAMRYVGTIGSRMKIRHIEE
ncbi:MAG: hypothetical protein IKY82_03950 [Alistipes sp.]|nr:hypothetical protein [Alistipes sp.]